METLCFFFYKSLEQFENHYRRCRGLQLFLNVSNDIKCFLLSEKVTLLCGCLCFILKTKKLKLKKKVKFMNLKIGKE